MVLSLTYLFQIFLCLFAKFDFCIPKTGAPSALPSLNPSEAPTETPSGSPTGNPSEPPTEIPSGSPTDNPSGTPTETPSGEPSKSPTVEPVTKKFYPFRSGDLPTNLDSVSLRSIVSALHGKDGQFEEHSNVLTKDECDKIIEFASARTNTTTKFDNRIDITPKDLTRLLPMHKIRTMHNLFLEFSERAAVTNVVVRVTKIIGEFGEAKHVPYHNDGDFDVMHVYLNNVQGGNLFYLTHSRNEERAAADIGHVVLHRKGIVHGVSSFQGTRYILILMNGNTKDPKYDILSPLYTESALGLVDEL